MSVATGDVGASHLPHMHALYFLCQNNNSICYFYTYSVITAEKTCYLKCINMTLKMSPLHGSFCCQILPHLDSGMEWNFTSL